MAHPIHCFIYPICNGKLIQLINTANLSGLKSEYAKWGQVYHNKTDQYGYHKIAAGEYICKGICTAPTAAV